MRREIDLHKLLTELATLKENSGDRRTEELDKVISSIANIFLTLGMEMCDCDDCCSSCGSCEEAPSTADDVKCTKPDNTNCTQHNPVVGLSGISLPDSDRDVLIFASQYIRDATSNINIEHYRKFFKEGVLPIPTLKDVCRYLI